MSEASWREEIVLMLKTLQIVVSALAFGPTVFLIVVGVLVAQGTLPSMNTVPWLLSPPRHLPPIRPKSRFLPYKAPNSAKTLPADADLLPNS